MREGISFKLEVINDDNSAKKFKQKMLQFYDGERSIFFSNYPGFQKFVEFKINDLDRPENIQVIREHHYMTITLDKIYTKSQKIQNAFACLIDIDADSGTDRDEVIDYATENYGKDILAIVIKGLSPFSKHLYGAHILINNNQDVDTYKAIRKDFVSKFDCVDKHMSFFCVKNPMYKYFRLK